jgi:hypothetical protein
MLVSSFDQRIEKYSAESILWFSEEEEIEIIDTSYEKNPEYPDNLLLFTVKLRSEAQEKFNQFVEDVILKRRG